MIIRKYKKTDAKQVAFIVKNTFARFNKKEGTKEAVDKYLSFYDLKKQGLNKLIETFHRSPIFYVAIEDNKVIGMVRGNEKRAINLFVLGKYHGKGIGRKLMECFEKEAKKKGSKEIRLRSSLYATSFYERIGYKKITGIRKFSPIQGLNVQPMKKELK